MAPNTPSLLLGTHTDVVREVVVDAISTRHNYAADAHQTANTRYGSVFGSQWRDLLDDVHEALSDRGFRSYPLSPGGYKLTVVNDCLVYVWRVPGTPGAVKNFASSPTRSSGFDASPPPDMLWEGDFPEEAEPGSDLPEPVMRETYRAKMPLILVMVQSSPRQLLSIDWAIAQRDSEGDVQLHGQEALWTPESVDTSATADVESFDSGAPVVPVVALQAQEGPTDA